MITETNKSESKYTCRHCGKPAHHIDFYNNDIDYTITAVYVYCKTCQVDAWGGLKFNPEMNQHLNEKFIPNFNCLYNDNDRSIVLVPTE